mgnify:CR=1 FL=1
MTLRAQRVIAQINNTGRRQRDSGGSTRQRDEQVGVVLFVTSGLYRPLPNSRIQQRLISLARACAIGFALHVLMGGWLQGRFDPTIEIAVPAWLTLGLAAFVSRFSWMSLSQHYKVIQRDAPIGKDQVDEVLVVGGAGYIGSVLTEQLLEAGYRVRILDMELFGSQSLKTMRWSGMTRMPMGSPSW